MTEHVKSATIVTSKTRFNLLWMATPLDLQGWDLHSPPSFVALSEDAAVHKAAKWLCNYIEKRTGDKVTGYHEESK